MTSLDDHAAAVARLLPRRRGVRHEVGAELAGRVLAADVEAVRDAPPFDNSQMDGYALNATQRAGGRFRVGTTVPAGTDPDQLYPEGIDGVVVPVMTGAKLPRDTAAVVAVERCAPPEFVDAGAHITIPAAEQGQFVRKAGTDTHRGEVLLQAGTTVTPAGVATLVGQQITEVEVLERCSLLIVTGGAEVGSSGAASIPDSNAPMLAALAARYDIAVAGFVRTNDDPDVLRADLTRAITEASPTVVVTSGGISAGKFEVVRQVLSADGWFGHVDQQPGGPQGVARFAGTPVVCLPGNPVSTLVSFRLFLAPVIGTAAAPVTAQLASGLRGLGDNRAQLLRGSLTTDSEGALVATPLGGTSSHLLAQAATADCLIRIPARADLADRAPVAVYPL